MSPELPDLLSRLLIPGLHPLQVQQRPVQIAIEQPGFGGLHPFPLLQGVIVELDQGYGYGVGEGSFGAILGCYCGLTRKTRTQTGTEIGARPTLSDTPIPTVTVWGKVTGRIIRAILPLLSNDTNERTYTSCISCTTEKFCEFIVTLV
jgi:hypothetical protein